MGIINHLNYIKMKQIKKTAGKTAPRKKLDLAYKYLDARSEVESLPKDVLMTMKTTVILLLEMHSLFLRTITVTIACFQGN